MYLFSMAKKMKTGFHLQWWLWWWFWLLVTILEVESWAQANSLIHLPQIQIACMNSTLLFPHQLNFIPRTVCHTELTYSARLNLFMQDFWDLLHRPYAYPFSMLTFLQAHLSDTRSNDQSLGPRSNLRSPRSTIRKQLPHLLAGNLLTRSWRVKLMVCI